MDQESNSGVGMPAAGPFRNAGPALAGERGPLAPRTFLPDFADERNRALDGEIRALEEELGSTQACLQENEEYSRVLAEHLESVRLEIGHTQAQLGARTRELESESHLRQLAARESGRLRSDIARLGARRAEAAQHATSLQTEVFKAGEKLAQFKLVQNWNQEELEQWAAAARQKEDDSLALERYRRQDEARVKELGMQLERAAQEVHQGRRDLEEERTATQAAHAELGKTAQDFRRLHEERQELLGQWEGVLKAISKRDATILEAGQEVAHCKASLATLQAELRGQAAELDAAKAAGHAAEKAIQQQERGITALYTAYGLARAGVADAEDQADLMSDTLGSTVDDVQRQLAAAGHLRAEIERREAAAAAARDRMEATRRRLQLEGQQLGSLQQKIQELEALRGEEQKKAEALERKLAALAKQQFRAGQALQAAQEEGRRLGAAISGARAQGRNLGHRMAQLVEQLMHQQEVRYNADFQLLQMERHVARAEGHRSRDETAALTARIAQLERELGAAAAEHGMLSEELKRTQDDHARAKRQSLAAQQERSSILDSMTRLEVESSTLARAAKAAAREREEGLVEVDVGKLEVQRLRLLLSSKSGEVMGLKTRKRGLEAGMAERRSEVEMQLELMQNEARLLRDEVHRLTAELNGRRQALEKLQRKHQTLVMKGRGQDGEETHSQAYYIIKAAQERQELTDQAEELRTRVAQTEQECQALEGALQRLLGTNSEMHWHARNGGAQDVVNEQQALRRRLDQANQELRAKQAEEAAAAAAVEQARARLELAAAEEAGTRQRLDLLQQKKAELQGQVREQQERRQRAEQRASRLLRQLQAKGTGQLPGGLSLEGLMADVQLRQVKEATKGMLEALRSLAAEHPGMGLAERLEAAAGIKLGASSCNTSDSRPSRPGSAASSLCGSGSGSVPSCARLGSPAGSRPGSGRCSTPGRAAVLGASSRPGSGRPGSCGGSMRSLRSTRSGTQSQSVLNMQLQL